jgi:two-component system sensor histidine kinase/response regulator
VSEGCRARGDRAAILQILDNLISNALKYSPPKTTVHVHTLPEREHVVVSVRDEGPGINEEDQKKLFQKFSRLSARPTGGESSTGLGLAIVKRLAEAMSGTVQCHSVPGSGATFSLRLPAWSEEEPEEDGLLLLTGETRMASRLVDPKRSDPSRN